MELVQALPAPKTAASMNDVANSCFFMTGKIHSLVQMAHARDTILLVRTSRPDLGFAVRAQVQPGPESLANPGDHHHAR